MTQLRRFAEAFACLPAALEFAQRGGSPQQASRVDDDACACAVAALEARRVPVLCLETPFAALKLDPAGAEA